jgi:hypothetical protein
MTRTRLSDALALLAGVVLVLAVGVGYLQRSVGDADRFADRATAALRDDRVRTVVAERVTDGLVRQEPDLLAARPLIDATVRGLTGSQAFTDLVRSAARDLHRAVVDGDEDTVTLTLTDVGTVVAGGLQAVRPGLAAKLEANRRVAVVDQGLAGASADVGRVLSRVHAVLIGLVVGWLALLVAALALARDRRRATVRVGIGTAGAAVVAVVALTPLRAWAVDASSDADARAAIGAVWDAFVGDLRTAWWLCAGVGAVLAAAAGSLLRPMPLGAPLRLLAERLAREPASTAGRALRGVAFLLAGVAVLVARDAVVSLLLTVAGTYLVYEGVRILLELVAPAGAAREPHPGGRRLPRPRRGVLVAGAAGLLLVLLVGAGAASTEQTGGAPRATDRCNGHRELCDRRLDEVALGATHNAMSVPLPGWYSAEQERPIAGQLADGVRGLLIDTHYADRLPSGRHRTVIVPSAARAREDGLSPETLAAALRIRDRLGFTGQGERGIYLCHTFCELGATPLGDVLADLRRFLAAHPGEVVVVVNQDEGVPPRAIVGAVRDAGLERFVQPVPRAGGRWPTLGEMVATGRRLVVLAEHQGAAAGQPGAAWYPAAYADGVLQETPYAFGRPSLLTASEHRAASCAENRGTPDAPLMLLNHWVSTDPLPRPSQASTVNARGPLLARARECARLRKRRVNLVAVNFYRRGDLLGVVDALNGVGGSG